VQVCTTAAASNKVRRHVIIFASNLNKQSCSECGLAYCFFSSGGSYAVDMKKVDAQNLSDWVHGSCVKSNPPPGVSVQMSIRMMP